MNSVVNALFMTLQYLVVIVMAPFTIVVCAGLLAATYFISLTLDRPKRMTPSTSIESYDWLRGPASEWLGA